MHTLRTVTVVSPGLPCVHGGYAVTTKTIISAVCAERFIPTPSYQICRFCNYADLCGE
ncbi:MAG: hypothetical protein LUQ04_06660 [Methanoregula sp.]|nr:hypothetical protein [Methanoregula sp.]